MQTLILAHPFNTDRLEQRRMVVVVDIQNSSMRTRLRRLVGDHQVQLAYISRHLIRGQTELVGEIAGQIQISRTAQVTLADMDYAYTYRVPDMGGYSTKLGG